MLALLTFFGRNANVFDVEQIYREFGRLLRERRKDAHLTQDEVANKVGLVRTSITNIEQGRQHVSLHMLFQLADAIGISAEQLLPERSAQPMSANLERQLKKESLEDEEANWIRRVVSKTQT